MWRWALAILVSSAIVVACVELSKVELACGAKFERGGKPLTGCWWKAEEKVR